MKKKFSTRLFSIFLSLLMVVTILPAGVIAAHAATNQVSQIISFAENVAAKNPHAYDGYCQAFVKACYVSAGYPDISTGTAYEAGNRWIISKSSTDIPIGACVYYGYQWNSKAGHVGIYAGNGKMYDAESNYGGVKLRKFSTKDYRGWGWYGGIKPSGSSGNGNGSGANSSNSGISGQAVVDYARTFIGKPYVWGAKGPNSFDCSGFVYYVFKHFGISLPASSKNYWNTPWTYGSVIGNGSTANAQPGDVISWNGHVAIYTGNGRCVEALNSKYGVTEQIAVNKHTNGTNYRVIRINGVGKINVEPPKPAVPVIPNKPNVNAKDIAKGKSVTITWNAVSGATGYRIGIRGAENKDIEVGNITSYPYTLNIAASYNFYIQAYNSSGTSQWSDYNTCTAHNPVTVSFVDWDNTPLGSQTIDYGSNATAPSAPQRKGYTFQGWKGSCENVTKDITIIATYKINTYIVNFFDRDGTLIDSQKVTYGGDATPPTDTHENSEYKFLGWNSTDYLNVYTDRADKNINIDGIYSWYNQDLPAVCTIQSATRGFKDYKIIVDVENNDSVPTSGRVVAALKTAEGKLVDKTESMEFSIPVGKTIKGMEIPILCSDPASTVEVFMIDDYSSGVPISPSVNSTIKQGLMYQESVVKPNNSDGTLDIQTVTQYSYRDKEFSTGNTKTKDGYIWDGTRKETLVNQTGYQDAVLSTYDNEFEKRVLLGTQSVPVYGSTWGYVYYHFHKPGGGSHTYCPTNHAGGSYHGYYYSTSPFTWSKKSSCGNRDMYSGPKCDQCGASAYWWYNAGDSKTITVQTGAKTQYNYATYQYTYNFYRWKTWSDWSDTQVSSNNNRDVRTRTIYRYASNRVQSENNTGKLRTVKGKLDSSFAEKQITLYVYGYTDASDYTNQYIGQSVVANDGSYSFTFKLLEEPTAETGDFTVAIGIEGTNEKTVIETIEAPKPTYEVKFYDWDGSVIRTQTVKEGESAVLPENPSKEGYNFIGWEESVANIKENMELHPKFEPKQYTVVFVDWENQHIQVKNFNHGDVLIPPETDLIEGYTFDCWDEIEKGNTTVTSDMVVSAQYSLNEYTVNFYDFDGNIVESQKVEHGANAIAPDLKKVSDGKRFSGWANPEEYQNVEHDISIYPTYYIEKTADIPTANYRSGEYNSKIQLELTTNEKNATIYYYLNEEPENKQVYSKPISIDKTCSVTYYATSPDKSDSAAVTESYLINPNTANFDKLQTPILKATVNANGTFKLSWNKVAEAEKYELYIKQTDGSYKLLKTTTGTSFTTGTAAYGKQYTYKMRALTGNTKSAYSAVVNATNTKKLQTPTMKAAVNANGTFKLSWNKVTGADKYELYIKQTDGSYKLMKTTNATSFTTAFATYGKQFTYKMRAVTSKNSSATSAYSAAVNATNNKKLQMPTLKVAVNSNGTFKLSWNAVTGATSYQLYIKQADGSYKLMKTTNATSFTTAFATYGKQFTYKMRAVTSKNSSATSAYSSAVNATNTKKLQTPTMKVTVNANGTFKLSWSAVAGATSYQLYIKQADGSYKLMKTTNATSFTTAFATYGKQFTYKMRAVTSKNSSATSAYSSAVNAKNNKKLQTPTLKVAVNKNGSFKLSWGKVTGTTSYQIYMKQSNGTYKLIKTTSSTSFTTAVAAKGKTYSYKVRAVTSKNKNATSNYSNVVNAKRK